MKQLDLRDTLGVLKRRWWIGALLTLLLGSLGYFYADGQTPTYGSSATVLIDFQSATQLINPLGNQLLGDPVRALQNEVRFIQSDKVLNQLFAQLGHIPNVRASSDANTDTLTFSSFSTDPEAAALEANAYAALYVKTRADRQVGNLDQATAALNGQLADLRSKLDKVPTGAADAGERSALQTQIRYYEGQVSALAVSADVGARSGATIIVAAQPSATPISPHPRRTAATAAAVGLLVGLGLALVLEYLDDTIRGAEQLSRVSPDLVLLARIPRQDSDARQHPSVASRSTQLGEAFRSLRTSIQFAGLRAPLRALQITSANPSEGKTTVACLLAVSLAQAGERVVLIDGDLRSPRVHERFGLGNEVGLSSVTLGQASLIEALQRVDDVPGLTVLASGPLPGNPADFLWSANVPDDVPTLPRLIKLLTDGGAFVIVDSPPVLPVADAMTLSRMVDGTLLVVGAGLAGSRSLLRALERLAQADANLIGQVINRVGADDDGYGYGYGYGQERATGLRHRLASLARRPRHPVRQRTDGQLPRRPSEPTPSQPSRGEVHHPVSVLWPDVSETMVRARAAEARARETGAPRPTPVHPPASTRVRAVGLAGNEPSNGHDQSERAPVLADSVDDDELIRRLRAHLGVTAPGAGRRG